MPGSFNFASIKARVIRLTRLNAAGLAVTGADSTIVTGGFTKIDVSPQVEEGDEYTLKTAWGDFCVNDKDDDRIKRIDLSIDFCQVNPAVLEMMMGIRPFKDASGNMLGGAVGEVMLKGGVAIETWTKLAGGAVGPNGEDWAYWLFPRVVGGIIGDFTLENGPLTLVMSAHTVGAAATWMSGPYTPSPLGTDAVVAGDHFAFKTVTGQPPQETNGSASFAGSVTATTATAGVPGTWSPVGSAVPRTVAEAIASEVAIIASPTTAWTTGQYVQTQAAGSAGQMHWNGTQWVSGPKP